MKVETEFHLDSPLTSVCMFLTRTGEKILVSWCIKSICQSAKLQWVTPTDQALRPSSLLDHSVAKEIVSVVSCIHLYSVEFKLLMQQLVAILSILSYRQPGNYLNMPECRMIGLMYWCVAATRCLKCNYGMINGTCSSCADNSGGY